VTRGSDGDDPWQRAEIFRSFVDQNDDLMLVVDPAGIVVYVNLAGERYLGVAREESLGRSLFDFVHPDDRERLRSAFERWGPGDAQSSLTCENRLRSWGGAERHVLWTVTPCRRADGSLRSLALCGRDVDAFWRLEGERERLAVRHRALLAGMLDPVVIIDPIGAIQYANDSVTSVFGYAPGELVGQNVRVLMPEPHRGAHDGYLERYRRTGQTGILNRTREFQVVHRNGSLLVCELSVSRVDVPGDGAPLFIGSFRDVSARKRAEQELARSEQRFRAIFDQEFQFVGLLSVDGTLIEINRTALEAAGLARADVVGRPFWETAWWADAPEGAPRLRQAIRAAAGGEFVRFDARMRNASGAEVELDFSLKPIRDERGEVVLLLPEGRDITALHEAQRRETAMLRALATIGESASLLAHEIKNPITGIHLALRAVADRLGEEHQALLNDLAERLQKLERTMRRTLSFARPLELRRAPASARALLEDAARAARPELERAGIALELACEEGLPELELDAALLEEALGNLLKNALEALPRGGRVRLSAAREGARALGLVVEDDGPGISPSLAPELFKPFVTDKSGGTGLGLALCKRIVEEHGGTIEAGRGALGGARFALHLPLSRRRTRGAGLRPRA